MGNGPAYDAMYERIVEHTARKRKTQRERAVMLHGILSKVGFGEHDGDLSSLEKEASNHLRLAYELFHLLSRS